MRPRKFHSTFANAFYRKCTRRYGDSMRTKVKVWVKEKYLVYGPYVVLRISHNDPPVTADLAFKYIWNVVSVAYFGIYLFWFFVMVGWDSMFPRSAIVCLGDFHTRQILWEILENLGVHRLECVIVCVYVCICGR